MQTLHSIQNRKLTLETTFPLRRPVGLGQEPDKDDIINLKFTLNRLGFFDLPHHGITPMPEPALTAAIKKFQSANALNVDGVVKPGGATARAIGARIDTDIRDKPGRNGKPFPGDMAENLGFDVFGRRARAEARTSERRTSVADSTEVRSRDGAAAGNVVSIQRPTSEKKQDSRRRQAPKIKPNGEPVSPEDIFRLVDFDSDGPDDVGNALRRMPSVFRLNLVSGKATNTAKRLFPGAASLDNPRDAFRHAYWSYIMSEEFGLGFAKDIGDGHERRSLRQFLKGVDPRIHVAPGGFRRDIGSQLMDLYNNHIGRELFRRFGNSGRDAEEIVMEALKQGRLQLSKFKIKTQ